MVGDCFVFHWEETIELLRTQPEKKTAVKNVLETSGGAKRSAEGQGNDTSRSSASSS